MLKSTYGIGGGPLSPLLLVPSPLDDDAAPDEEDAPPLLAPPALDEEEEAPPEEDAPPPLPSPSSDEEEESEQATARLKRTGSEKRK
jgi:hypothetical protein